MEFFLYSQYLLHRAIEDGDYFRVSDLMKDTCCSSEAKNQDMQTAVHLASRLGKVEILKKLIDSGANINCRDSAGYTPLQYACQNNLPNTVQLLISHGANIHARHPDTGRVPLHEAAKGGWCQVARVLLAFDAPVRPRTIHNETPEELAIIGNHLKCFKMLMNYKRPEAKAIKEQWYHGNLDRNKATALLRDKPSGTFLIRYSDCKGGAHILTLICEGKLFNYIIRKQDKFLFIQTGPYLESLEHIVDYYSCMADDLPTTLQHPLLPQPNLTFPEPGPRSKSPFPIVAINLLPNDVDNNWDPIMIPHEHIKDKTLIGIGKFGIVERAFYSGPQKITQIAVKTIYTSYDKKDRELFLKQIKIMMQLNHHCIIKLIGVCHDENFMLVQEYAEFGSLLKYLLEFADRISPDCELKLWASQIACGMKYLEEQRLVHRDLAARKILLTSRNQAKISEFGFSRNTELLNGKRCLKWYAPESYKSFKFSSASDVWSFGVLLWEMYSFGLQPFGDREVTEVIQAINKGERLPKPSKCPDNIYKTMLQCWEFNPQERPTFAHLSDQFSSDPVNTELAGPSLTYGRSCDEEEMDIIIID